MTAAIPQVPVPTARSTLYTSVPHYSCIGFSFSYCKGSEYFSYRQKITKKKSPRASTAGEGSLKTTVNPNMGCCHKMKDGIISPHKIRDNHRIFRTILKKIWKFQKKYLSLHRQNESFDYPGRIPRGVSLYRPCSICLLPLQRRNCH